MIIPLFNRVHLIERAVKSIIDQSFSDWELVIIDDCSTDGSWELINTFDDKRIRVLRNEQNSERCVSRNNGIEASVGRYICFLDSDDYHLKDHLQKFFNVINKNDSSLKCFLFSNAWNESSKGVRAERTCPDFTEYESYTYFLRFTVNPQRWAVKREVMLDHLFDPDVIICEDMDTSLRMVADDIPVFQLQDRTTVYVETEDSFTHGAKDKWEKELFYLKRIFNKPVLRDNLLKKEKNRLRSMCHYHITVKNYTNGNRYLMYLNALASFFLFPKGYNGRTNKSLVVMMIYGIPIIGSLLAKTVRVLKMVL